MADYNTFLKQLNNTAATASSITALKNITVALGITAADPCNPTSVAIEIQKAIEDWLKNTNETIDKLACKIGGNFIATIGILLAEVLGASATVVTDQLLTAALVNPAGVLLGTVMSALSVVNGADSVIQYYEIKQLAKLLSYRTTLLNILQSDISSLVNYLSFFVKFSASKPTQSPDDMKKIQVLIKQAQVILNAENTRIASNPNTILPKQTSIISAKNSLDSAADLLVNNKTKGIENFLSSIEHHYGLTVQAKKPSSGAISINTNTTPVTFLTWYTYIIALSKAINQKFTQMDAKPGTSEYNAEVNYKKQLYMQLLTDLIPGLPDVIQGLMLQYTIGEAIKVLIAKIPLYTNIFNTIEQVTKTTNLSTIFDPSTLINNAMLSTGLINKSTQQTQPFFTNEETKDYTVQSITTGCKGIEAAILKFPLEWKTIITIGSAQISILKQVLTNLATVQSEINEAIIAKVSAAEMLAKRAEWAVLLTADSASLNILIENKISINGHTVSASQFQNTTQLADEKLAQIKESILAKSYNVNTNETLEEPVDIADKIAQQNLGPLIANIAVFLSTSATKRILAGLQSIKLLYTKQIAADSIELNLCNDYITIMENDPNFMLLKEYIDKLLNKFAKTTFGKAANALLTGDLDTVLNVATGVDDVVGIVQGFGCAGSKSTDKYLQLLPANPLAGSAEKAKITNLVKEIKQSLNSIIEQKQILSDQLDAVNDLKTMVAEQEQEQVNGVSSVTTTITSDVSNGKITESEYILMLSALLKEN